MAVFKIEKCYKCSFKRHEPKPNKDINPCPKCGAPMKYLNNWYLSYQVLGKKYVEVGGQQKRFAEDVLSSRRVAIREGRSFDKAPQTPWPVAVNKFKDIHYKQGSQGRGELKPDTCRMYDNSLSLFDPHFKFKTLDKITYDDIKEFISFRQAQGLTPSTINKDIITIKCLLNFAELHDMLEMSKTYRKIVQHIKPTEENNRRTRILSADEEAAIMAYPNKDLRLQCLISLESGLRKEGCLSLAWPELDFTPTSIHPFGYIHKTIGIKGDTPTNVPLTHRLSSELIKRKAVQTVLSKYIFFNQGNTPIVDNKTAFNTMCDKLSLQGLHFHDLRRSFATRFIKRTGKWEQLRKILGHQDIKTTMRYVHLDDKDVADAMEEFERKVSPQVTAV